MHVELLIIGDEILDGTVVDENSTWLGSFLNDKGVRVQRQTTVPDSRESVANALSQIVDRSDLCICTGGLGPTDDDLTLETVAAVAQDELIFDQKIWSQIVSRYAGKPVPENNRKQAYVLKTGAALEKSILFNFTISYVVPCDYMIIYINQYGIYIIYINIFISDNVYILI